jgi:hypothetical protein
MIKPTVGKAVHYYYPPGLASGARPEPATISFVHSETVISIEGTDGGGVPWSRAQVPLIQADMEEPSHGHFCRWPPKQLGDAIRK